MLVTRSGMLCWILCGVCDWERQGVYHRRLTLMQLIGESRNYRGAVLLRKSACLVERDFGLLAETHHAFAFSLDESGEVSRRFGVCRSPLFGELLAHFSERRVGTLYVPTRCGALQIQSRGQNKVRFAHPTNCTASVARMQRSVIRGSAKAADP